MTPFFNSVAALKVLRLSVHKHILFLLCSFITYILIYLILKIIFIKSHSPLLKCFYSFLLSLYFFFVTFSLTFFFFLYLSTFPLYLSLTSLCPFSLSPSLSLSLIFAFWPYPPFPPGTINMFLQNNKIKRIAKINCYYFHWRNLIIPKSLLEKNSILFGLNDRQDNHLNFKLVYN